MGLLRYIVQGFGNEVGARAARGAIEEIKDQLDDDDERPSLESVARAAEQEARAARREARRREKQLLRQLKKLKRQARREG